MTHLASELRILRREIVRLNRRAALAHLEAPVAEVDEKKWMVRLELGTDADGEPILSPWVRPFAKSAGAYADSPPLPAKRDRMILVSPSGVVGAASYAAAYPFDDELKRPNADKEESARAYGKTRVAMTKDTLTSKTEKTTVTQTADGFSAKAEKKAEVEADETRLKGKTTRIHAESLDKLKLIVGDTPYQIRPEALLPTSA